jgi:hypothetical protein
MADPATASPALTQDQGQPASDTVTKGELHRTNALTSSDGCQRLASDRPALPAAQVSEVVVTRPTTSPADVAGIDAHEARLAHAARSSSPTLAAADTVAAVEAGMLADAVDMATSRSDHATTESDKPSMGPRGDVGARRLAGGLWSRLRSARPRRTCSA